MILITVRSSSASPHRQWGRAGDRPATQKHICKPAMQKCTLGKRGQQAGPPVGMTQRTKVCGDAQDQDLIRGLPPIPIEGRFTVPCSLGLQTAQHNRVSNEVSFILLTQERPNHLREHCKLCRAQELGVAPNLPWAGLSWQSSVHTNTSLHAMLAPHAPSQGSIPFTGPFPCCGVAACRGPSWTLGCLLPLDPPRYPQLWWENPQERQQSTFLHAQMSAAAEPSFTEHFQHPPACSLQPCDSSMAT